MPELINSWASSHCDKRRKDVFMSLPRKAGVLCVNLGSLFV